MKIGILKEGFGLPFSEPDVDAIVKDAAGKLASVGGATVEEVSIPMHSDGNFKPSLSIASILLQY